MRLASYIEGPAGWRVFGLIEADEPDAIESLALHRADAATGLRAFVLDGTPFAECGLRALPLIADLAAVADELAQFTT